MKRIFHGIQPHFILAMLVLVGLVFTGSFFGSNAQQSPLALFSDLSQFVLVANENIELGKQVQVSSGDLAANDEIEVDRNALLSSNLFADELEIDEDTMINGNISFNTADIDDGARVLGEQTPSIVLPIVQLPVIAPFSVGNNTLKIKEDQALSPGAFKNIEVAKGITLTLFPGTYNIAELKLKKDSTLLFSSSTTINIQKKFKADEHVMIAQTSNAVTSTDLVIQFIGKKPVKLGKENVLSLQLIAPQATVKLGQRSIFRGQLLAKKIKIGRDSVLSRDDFFEKESDLTNIVEDQDGIKFVVNEIVIFFEDGATLNDLFAIADAFNLQATGFLPNVLMGKLETQTETIAEVEALVDRIKASSNPIITDVLPNILML